jgi:hypothetical protein
MLTRTHSKLLISSLIVKLIDKIVIGLGNVFRFSGTKRGVCSITANMKTKEGIDFISTNGVLSILEQVRLPQYESFGKRCEHKSTLRRLEFIALISEKINEAVSEKNYVVAARLQEIYDFYSVPEFMIQLSSKGYYLWKQEFFESFLLHIYILLVDFESEPLF